MMLNRSFQLKVSDRDSARPGEVAREERGSVAAWLLETLPPHGTENGIIQSTWLERSAFGFREREQALESGR
jgi:hypothetical protein